MEKTFICDVCGKEIPLRVHNQVVCNDCRVLLERARALYRYRDVDLSTMSRKELVAKYIAEKGLKPRKKKRHQMLKVAGKNGGMIRPKYNGRRCRLCGRRLRINYFYCHQCHQRLGERCEERMDGNWVYT